MQKRVGAFIHDQSQQKDHPFIHLNCAAVPTTLLEGDLLQRAQRRLRRDARSDRRGTVASAADGTLFLDEVGEIPVKDRPKLLHALETGRVRPLGVEENIAIKTRLSRPPTGLSKNHVASERKFESDLSYRLNSSPCRKCPPLRARRDDILPLVDAILARADEQGGRQIIRHIFPATFARLLGL